ncbi:MAG: ATP synthase F1 subunit epsilon [Eubacteriales bacterium]
MKAFHLEILSPDRPFFVGDCVSVTVPIGDGMIGIMAGHSPLIAAVVPGEVTYVLPDGESFTAAVTQGLINVSPEGARLLCDSVLRPEEIDEEAEKRDAELAMANMKRGQSYRDYKLAQLTFARAVNNLRVKNKKNMNN